MIPLWYANVVGGWSEKVDNVVFNWKSVPVYNQITKKAEQPPVRTGLSAFNSRWRVGNSHPPPGI